MSKVVLLLTLLFAIEANGKPNFIIMFMDDMGWGDLGCYGNPADETPHLDQMAEEGIRFTDFYTGSAICSPSRASLMTGRLPVRNGFYSTNQFGKNSYSPQDVMGGIADSEILLPEELAKAGYRNKIIGKWHLGHREQYLPLRHGFHEWFGAPNCHYKYDDEVMPNIPVYKDHLMTGRYYDHYKIDHSTGAANLTQIYIAEALEFIEKQANAKEPFFLYWTPDATHTPVYASEKFIGKSKRGRYGDAVMELDYGVGQILNKVKELGLEDETFSFFSSDNGAATYAHEEGGSNGPFLCGKQTTYEGGFRQPAIAHYPGHIQPHRVSGQVGKLMDLHPTILDLAGIKPPANVTLDGESIKEVLLDSSKPTYDRSVFYYRGNVLFHARHGQYKAHYYTWGTPLDAQQLDYHYCPGQYVKNVTDDEMHNFTSQPLLFNLGTDPGEKWPLSASTEEYRRVMKIIDHEVEIHKKNMEWAEPEFNYCDLGVQNWAPKGCEKVDSCFKPWPSHPYKCDWPY